MKLTSFAAATALLLTSSIGMASQDHARAELDITIENLTNAITFRPFLVAAHDENSHMFRAGEPASVALQVMAECGGIDMLADELHAGAADILANPVDTPLGLLFPAGSTPPAMLADQGMIGSVSGRLTMSRGNPYLSIVAMLLPTNDAFAGLDAVKIPKKPGTYVFYLNAYDAGTEANDEIPADDNPLDCMIDEPGYPIDPLGNTGTGGSGVFDPQPSTSVHVHRSQVGDADLSGGASDLVDSVHRWLNPVVKVTVKVKRRRN
jgi:hypothetical protein